MERRYRHRRKELWPKLPLKVGKFIFIRCFSSLRSFSLDLFTQTLPCNISNLVVPGKIHSLKGSTCKCCSGNPYLTKLTTPASTMHGTPLPGPGGHLILASNPDTYWRIFNFENYQNCVENYVFKNPQSWLVPTFANKKSHVKVVKTFVFVGTHIFSIIKYILMDFSRSLELFPHQNQVCVSLTKLDFILHSSFLNKTFGLVKFERRKIVFMNGKRQFLGSKLKKPFTHLLLVCGLP